MKKLRIILGAASLVIAGSAFAHGYIQTSEYNTTLRDSGMVYSPPAVTARGYVDADNGKRSTVFVIRHRDITGRTEVHCPGLTISSSDRTRAVVVAHKSQAELMNKCMVKKYHGTRAHRVDVGFFGANSMSAHEKTYQTINPNRDEVLRLRWL